MAREKSPTDILFDKTIKVAVTDVVKPAGFRKSGLNFHRRYNKIVQVINVQCSSGNTSAEKKFYINVGLAFDEVCRLTSSEILEKPKEYECESRGFSRRFEILMDSVPDCWGIDSENAAQTVSQELKPAIEQLMLELELVDCAKAYREHRWFKQFHPSGTNAQIHYVLGETLAARNEVQSLCKRFADRRVINRPEHWVDKLGLADLDMS